MSARVVALRPDVDGAAAANRAWAALDRHLDRANLSGHTRTAYRRQARTYLEWLAAHVDEHPDAWVDVVGAQGAVSAWRKQLLARLAPPSVNQGIAAVTLLYEVGAHLSIQVKRARVPKPGEPDALTRPQENAVRRAADRRGVRDAAIIAVLLGTGARVSEAARLEVGHLVVTTRTGTCRLYSKGDQVRTVPVPRPVRERIPAWLAARTQLLAERPGLVDAGEALWLGKRGVLSTDGITDVVRTVGVDANLPGLRPHRLRHTYATRLREGGADAAVIQALLGYASIDTAGRYFCAGKKEITAAVDRALEY